MPTSTELGLGTRIAWAVTRRAFGLYMRVVKVKVLVTGQQIDRSTATLFVSNHLSSLDPFVVAFQTLPCRAHFVAKTALFRGPTGWWIRAVGAWNAALGSTPVCAVKALRAGHAVAIFPEGHRGRGPLQVPSDGAAAIAYLADVPIVPIAITGTEHALPCGSWMPRPAVIEVRVGKPFRLPRQIRGIGEARWKPASQLIMTKLAALLPLAYQPHNDRT